MQLRILFLGISCLLFSLSAARAQTLSTSAASTKAEVDYQFRRILDETGFPNTIDSDGDFKLTLSRENGRSQIVFAYSNISTLKNMAIREIVSAAYTFPPPMDRTLAERVLKMNGDYKIGAWKISGPRKSDGKMVLQFYVKIPAMLDAESLRTILVSVAITADDMEKEITGTDER